MKPGEDLSTDDRRQDDAPWLTAPEVIDLYGQGDYWIDRDRNRHEIPEMPTGYLENLVGFVEKWGPRHLFAAAVHYPTPVSDSWHAERAWTSTTGDAIRWAARITDTPLHAAIVAELESRGPWWRRWFRG